MSLASTSVKSAWIVMEGRSSLIVRSTARATGASLRPVIVTVAVSVDEAPLLSATV